MSEFCKCGSLVLSGQCTNKNCAFKTSQKPLSPKQSTRKSSASSSVNKETKSARVRRSSKCITYNLNDIKKDEAVE